MTIGKTVYEIVGTVQESGLGYEWHEGALLRDPEGNLFFIYGSGCSCNYLGDDYTEETLPPVYSYSDAVEMAKQDFSDAEVFDFAQQLFGPGR